MGFIAHHGVKWGLIGDRVMGDTIGPRCRVVSTEDLKIGFYLVYSFGLSVQLSMVGSGEGKVIFQEFSKFPSEGGCKLRASVRNDPVIEAKAKVYFVEKEWGYAFGSVVLLHGTENYPLSKPMVYHDQEGMKASGRGEVGDKVTRDLLEGHRGTNGCEWGNSGVCVGLVLLAGCTAFHVFVDLRGQARSPEVSHNELGSF